MGVRKSLAAVVLCLAAGAGARESAAPSDAFGRPLRAEDGSRIEYAGPRDVSWSIGTPVATLDPPPMPGPRPKVFDPLRMRDDATLGNFTQDLGTRGIHAADLDADGIHEIVVAHGVMWYVLAWEPLRAGYHQRVFHEYGQGSTFGGGPIADVRVGDPYGSGALRVVVMLNSGDIEVWDAMADTLEVAQSLGLTGPDDFEFADVDGLPGDELVVLHDGGVSAYSVGLGTPLWTVPGITGRALAVGNVDSDPGLEVVVGDNTAPGIVVDVATRAVEWSYPTGFGAFVDVADVDGDGLDEIAGCFDWGDCLVVDGDTRLEKWSFDNFDSSAIRCRDVDGDGIPEVGIGDGQWGDVHFRSGLDGTLVGRVENPEHSVAFLDFADVDGDCEAEVLWGAGYTSTGEDHLFVGTLRTQAYEWKNLEYDGPMHAFAIGDVDADGRTEIVRACSDSDAGYDGAYVFVTDLHQRIDEHVPSAQTNDGWMVTQGMALFQTDADAPLEYVMNDSRTYSGKVSAFDGVTHQRQWTSVIFDGEYVNSIESGDVDGDGTPELLVGTGRAHTGALGVFLRILSAADGSVLYTSPSFAAGFGAEVDDIRVADVDGDLRNEIAFVVGGQGVRLYDGITRAEEWFLPNMGASALDVADIPPGGALEILVGDESGNLVAYDGDTHAEVWRAAQGAGSIEAIRAGDVDGDGTPEIALTFVPNGGQHGVVRVLDASVRTLLWTSPPIVGRPGVASSLRIADVDDDGQQEIVVSGSYTVRVFEHDDGLGDLGPPTFAGVANASPIVSTSCCPSVDVTWTAASDDFTPPMRYEVHRGTAPGFAVDAASRVGSTDRTSWRDTTVGPDTTYWYIVRALDGAGNEEGNFVEASATTPDTAPPSPVTITSVTDPLPCDLGGVDVAFVPPTPPAGITFDLEVDGVPAASGVTSPHRHLPGDGASHDYRIVARSLACDLRAPGNVVAGVDGGVELPPPVITAATDLDSCLRNGLSIAFTHGGFAGVGHYDVLMDGGVHVSDVVSPVVVAPPDGLPHSWVIRAVDDTCVRWRDSQPAAAQDSDRQPAPPAGIVIEDPDPCAASLLRVTFTHGGFAGLGHYELWRDGAQYLVPVSNGQSFPPGDALLHDYVVRAVDVDCALSTDSAPAPGQDMTDCPPDVGEVSLRLARDPLDADVTHATWSPASGNVARHDLYVGTLASLHGARAYDHVPQWTQLTFPAAPDPSTGCAAADAATLESWLRGLRSGDYVLVVAVSTSGRHGPYGARSDGVDRHDPSVDPRPPSVFCP